MTAKKSNNLERTMMFRGLMEKMRESGFRPADVARLLNKTPVAVSQYLSGYTTPSETVIELLSRISTEKAKADDGQGGGILNRKLADLQRWSASEFEVVKNTIEMFHERLAGRNKDVAAEYYAPVYFKRFGQGSANPASSVESELAAVESHAKNPPHVSVVKIEGAGVYKEVHHAPYAGPKNKSEGKVPNVKGRTLRVGPKKKPSGRRVKH
jgi:predicted transcriptional regulator